MNFLLDELATAYERKWAPENRGFSRYLSEVSCENHDELLELLIEIDIEKSLANNLTPDLDDYRCYGAKQYEFATRFLTNCLTGFRSGQHRSKKLTSEQSLQFGSQLGPYELKKPIAAGGMGQVFVAEQIAPIRRTVALKIIRTNTPTVEVLTRFNIERQALAAMDHPHIAKVFDAGETEEGRPYFAMEYVDGQPINDFCRSKSISLDGRLRLFVQACQAVQHAHIKGIVHRDIKPSNILVSRVGEHPSVKVIDFGLAKALHKNDAKLRDETQFTQIGQVIGTPAYMSPEQASSDGSDIDARTDVYSLGAVLYELLTGTTPIPKEFFGGKPLEQVLKSIREREIESPSRRILAQQNRDRHCNETQVDRVAPQYRRDLDWVVGKALEKDREQRFGTASALAEDIQRHLNGDPVLASPPRMTYRARKFLLKHKYAVLSVSALLLLLTTSLFWFVMSQLQRESIRTISQLQSETQAARLEAEWAAGWNEYRSVLANLTELADLKEFGRLKQAMDSYLATQPSAEFRGWEWSHLASLVGDAFHEFPDVVSSSALAINAAGTEAAIMRGSDLLVVGVSDLLVHRSITLEGTAAAQVKLAWSPAGERLAVSINDNAVSKQPTIKILHAKTLKTIDEGKILGPRSSIVRSLLWCPSGEALVVANAYGDIAKVNLDSWTEETIHSPNEYEPDHCGGVSLHPSTPQIGASLRFGRKALISLAPPLETTFCSTLNLEVGLACAWSPNGSIFAASEGTDISLFSTKLHRNLLIPAHNGLVSCLEWKDNRTLVSAGTDGRICAWDVASGEAKYSYSVHHLPIESMCIETNTGQVMTIDRSGCLRKSSLMPSTSCVFSTIQTSNAKCVDLRDLEWSPSGLKLLSSVMVISDSGSFSWSNGLWDLETLSHSASIPAGLTRSTSWRDDNTIAVITAKGRLGMYDVGSHTFSDCGPLSFAREGWQEEDRIYAAWQPSGDTFAVGFRDDQKVLLYEDFCTSPASMQINQVSSRLLSWNPDGTSLVLDKHTIDSSGKVVSRPDPIREFCEWNPKLNIVAVGNPNNGVELRTQDSFRLIRSLRAHIGPVVDACWNCDGDRLATASSDGTVCIWGGPSFDKLLTLSPGNSLRISSLAWHPSGKILVASTTQGGATTDFDFAKAAQLCFWGVKNR